VDARALIETLQRRGLGIALVGNAVKITAPCEPDADTKALLRELKEHKAEVVSVLAERDPVIPAEQWYPHFREFHHKVISETPDFDYGELRKQNPDLFRQIKAKENEIDALGAARLSEVLAIMAEWRQFVLGAMFEQRQRKAEKGI
jgi:hypothetical protein